MPRRPIVVALASAVILLSSTPPAAAQEGQAYTGDDIIGQTIRDSIINGGNVRDSDLYGVRLRALTIDDSRIENAAASNLTIRGSTILRATLFQATIENSGVTGAWIERTTMRGGSLSDATVRGVTLSGVRLCNVHFLDEGRVDRSGCAGAAPTPPTRAPTPRTPAPAPPTPGSTRATAVPTACIDATFSTATQPGGIADDIGGRGSTFARPGERGYLYALYFARGDRSPADTLASAKASQARDPDTREIGLIGNFEAGSFRAIRNDAPIEVTGTLTGFAPGTLYTAVVVAIPGDPDGPYQPFSSWLPQILATTLADSPCHAYATVVTGGAAATPPPVAPATPPAAPTGSTSAASSPAGCLDLALRPDRKQGTIASQVSGVAPAMAGGASGFVYYLYMAPGDLTPEATIAAAKAARNSQEGDIDVGGAYSQDRLSMAAARASPRFEFTIVEDGFTPSTLHTVVLLAVAGNPAAAPEPWQTWEARALGATLADATCMARGTVLAAAPSAAGADD